eukprot:212813_1
MASNNSQCQHPQKELKNTIHISRSIMLFMSFILFYTFAGVTYILFLKNPTDCICPLSTVPTSISHVYRRNMQEINVTNDNVTNDNDLSVDFNTKRNFQLIQNLYDMFPP